MSVRTRAIFFLVIATLGWSLSFVVFKALAMMHGGAGTAAGAFPTSEVGAASAISPAFTTASSLIIRFGVSGAVLALAAIAMYRRQLFRPDRWPQELRAGLGLTLLGGGGIFFQMDALHRIDASTSAFLTQCYCVFLPLVAATRTRTRPARGVILSTALVLVGVAILSGFDRSQLRLGTGETETLLASLFFTAQILWLEKASFRDNRPVVTSALMFLGIGAVIAATLMGNSLGAPGGPREGVASLVHGFASAYSSAPALYAVGALTLFSTLMAYTLMNAFQSRVTSVEAGFIYCLEPVFASLVALALPAWISQRAGIAYANEILSSRLLWGGALITLANLVILRRSPPPEAC